VLTPEEINAMNLANEEKKVASHALAEFHRRNRFRRRQSQVQLLLAKLKGKPIDTDQS
jgi:hypothetical protein